MLEQDIVKSALWYIKKGVSVVPVKDKIPMLKEWSTYQKKLMSEADITKAFNQANAIATIGGVVSGNREMIDIDCKYDISGTLWSDYSTQIRDHDPELWDRLVKVRTPSGGYHLIYRVVGGCSKNGKLANRNPTKEELEADTSSPQKVLIEIKAEGGYCVAPPSKGYEFISTVYEPPIISEEQKDLLLSLARGFNEVVDRTEQAPKRGRSFDSDRFINNPFEEYNKRGDIVEHMVGKHGWTVTMRHGGKTFLKRPGGSDAKTSGNFSDKHNCFICFSTSTEFESGKAYSPSAAYCLLNHKDDWAECAKDLLSQGYGKEIKHIDSKYSSFISTSKRNGRQDTDIVRNMVEKMNVNYDQAEQILQDYNDNQGKTVSQFWVISYPKNSPKPRIDIHLKRFVDFISGQLDIYRFRFDENEKGSVYIKIQGNTISEVTITDIKDAIKDYIETLDLVFDGIQRNDLMEVIQRNSRTLFSDEQLEFLDYASVKILKSTATEAYFPFRNCIVKVSKSGFIEPMDYSSFNDYVVWKKNIIQHNFEFTNDDDDFSYTRFLKAINNFDQARIDRCFGIIGYLLHDYKNPTEGRCVIFGEETSKVNAGGGTGKGLLTTAIGKMIKTISVDGKNFDASKSFAWQRVSLGDKIVIMQDTHMRFDFEKFFSIITDGLPVERKNKAEVYIPYSDSPKFLITTNYTISNESTAARRRQYLLEFSSYYSDTRTPYEDLGEYMFYGWDNEKWNKFYTLMLGFCYTYLHEGVKDIPESDTSLQKRIEGKYGSEFYEWFTDYTMDDYKYISDMHEHFLQENSLKTQDYSMKKFQKAIEITCQLTHRNLDKKKDTISKKSMYKW